MQGCNSWTAPAPRGQTFIVFFTPTPLGGCPLPSLGVFSCMGVWGAQYAVNRALHRRSIHVDLFPFFLLDLVHWSQSKFTGGTGIQKTKSITGKSRASRRISKQHRNQKGTLAISLHDSINPTQSNTLKRAGTWQIRHPKKRNEAVLVPIV